MRGSSTLSLGAAAVGLAIAGPVLGWLDAELEQQGVAPFWVDVGLSTDTILYAGGLAVLAAALVGIVPALKATGRGLRSRLGELRGATGMRLGKTWTALIVAQVAFAVAILPAGVFNAWDWSRYGLVEPEIAAEEFLTARLVMEREDGGRPPAGADARGVLPSGGGAAQERRFQAVYGIRLGELARRLEAEPGVADVAFASRLPGVELPAEVEIDGVPVPADFGSGYGVRLTGVDVGLFDAFGVPILAGRGFRRSDLGLASTTVIVNQAFVEEILNGGSALGRRIRYVWVHAAETAVAIPDDEEPGPWHEIVGVVSDDLTVGIDPGETAVRVYHPMTLGPIHPVSIAVRIRGGATAGFAPRLREIAAAVDPTLQATEITPFDEVLRRMQMLFRLTALAIGLVTLSVLLLSAAGIHALMSFTVARSRKEIGIRAALGARPRRLLAGIFARALGQLALGALVGIGAAIMLNDFVDLTDGQGAVVVPAVAALMLAVGLLAALGPARRGLRIEPTEALRAE